LAELDPARSCLGSQGRERRRVPWVISLVWQVGLVLSGDGFLPERAGRLGSRCLPSQGRTLRVLGVGVGSPPPVESIGDQMIVVRSAFVLEGAGLADVSRPGRAPVGAVAGRFGRLADSRCMRPNQTRVSPSRGTARGL
jgi:hypothetical protein